MNCRTVVSSQNVTLTLFVRFTIHVNVTFHLQRANLSLHQRLEAPPLLRYAWSVWSVRHCTLRFLGWISAPSGYLKCVGVLFFELRFGCTFWFLSKILDTAISCLAAILNLPSVRVILSDLRLQILSHILGEDVRDHLNSSQFVTFLGERKIRFL